MKSVQLQKYPPQSDDSIVRDGLRAYLRYYGLILDRFAWAADNQSTNLPYDDIQRYIAQLTDPLAFREGETQLIKDIESEFQQIRDGDWNGEQFRIKTIAQSAGSNGWFIFAGTMADVITLAGHGTDSGSLSEEYITFPPAEDEWLETRIQIDEWKTEFDEKYANPEDGDMFEIGFAPSESGLFQLHFASE